MQLDACSGKLSAKRVPWTPVIVFETSWPRTVQRGPTPETPAVKQEFWREDNDARTGMPFGMPKGAMCVQRFDDSRKFCNSHYLSHFAAFFIDARTKRSVVESFVFDWYIKRSDSELCFTYILVWEFVWLGHRRTLSRGGRVNSFSPGGRRCGRETTQRTGPPKQHVQVY